MFVGIVFDFGSIPKGFETVFVDVNKVWGKGNGSSCEVGEEMKCCYWAMKDGTVKLAEDVCSSEVSGYDDERTKVSWTHFAIQGLFDLHISHKY